MLRVDLNRLRASRSVTLDEDVPTDSALFAGSELTLSEPLHVELEAQQAGSDVVVRGRMEGRVATQCRRCLTPLEVALEEPVSALFTPTLTEEEADGDEVYPLPEDSTLELGGIVRESALLAAPRFAVCSESCRGLCPQCGADLNATECGCTEQVVDERWGPLLDRKKD